MYATFIPTSPSIDTISSHSLNVWGTDHFWDVRRKSEGHDGHVDIEQHSLGEDSVLVKTVFRGPKYDIKSNDTTQSQPSRLKHRITSDQTFSKD